MHVPDADETTQNRKCETASARRMRKRNRYGPNTEPLTFSEKVKAVPQRWGIRFSVEGDLRFASHRDMMRTVQCLSFRAGLPLRFSQGFNPQPRFSLACPRPVGIASMDDLLVATLEASAEITGPEILEKLNATSPAGMKFFQADELASKGSSQPERAEYELDIDPADQEALQARLAELGAQPSWPVERRKLTKPSARAAARSRTIDLKPLVTDLRTKDQMLRWTLQPKDDLWARPSELLGLLGLEDPAYLAAVVRRKITYHQETGKSPQADGR